MKTNLVGFLTFLLFAFLVCSSYSTSAHRLLQQKQGEKDQFKSKEDEITQPGLLTDANEDFSHLMGSEECHEKDEECVERRMIADAHLDYIYTQHHKP